MTPTASSAPLNVPALADLKTPWCLRVVVTLGIPELVAGGVTGVKDLAARARCDAETLHRVLRHLANKGVFEETSFGVFELNDPARDLLESGLRLFLDLDGIGGRFAQVWSTMPSYVRTGRSAYPEVFGRGFWDDLAANPAIAASFDALMGPVGHGTRDGDLPLVDGWERAGTVVDVGGGTGALLAAILRAHPQVRGVLVDLPGTVARSGETFDAAGVTDRVTTVGQSFFDALPAGGDVYVLSGVLNDWADDEATAILRRCAEAAGPTSSVVVMGRFPDGDPPRGLEIEMLLAGGKDRSLSEFKVLAAAAGLELVAVHQAAVECRPAVTS